MQTVRKFLINTPQSPDGVVYTYDSITEIFVAVEIQQENMPVEAREKVIGRLFIFLNLFLQWCQTITKKGTCEVIELQDNITFEMMWDRYNDKSRSSKKKCLIIWNRMSIENRVKAYYFYPRYMRNKGEAEKKYLETYLNAELWNN